tara:strand:- start:606 stop:1736 length:1131 start_codon:yes stop_codon:yes gene_type:complete
MMFECFQNQTYPKNRIEWIIVDDGSDKIEDLILESNIQQIRYFKIDKKMALGEKRNYMHSKVNGEIIVYMDDDDYYPPERISHSVETLQKNPEALCAGASEIYIFFKHIQKMIQCGPYGPNHATAGTFAFRKKLLETSKYENHAAIAEERAFLKDYTVPFAQMDPLKTILVFSHEHNTFDKRKMFDNAHPQFFKESDKTVDTFIRMKKEKSIKEFFLKTIDEKLKNYEPGEPKNKPDVLEQIKEIESKRDELIKAEMEKMKGNGPIMLQQPGQEPKALSNQEVVNIMQGQMQQLQQFANEKQQLENMVKQLQEQLMRKTKEAKIAKDMVKKLQQELKDKDETPSSTRMQIEVVDQIEDKNPFSKTEPENFVQIQGD